MSKFFNRAIEKFADAIEFESAVIRGRQNLTPAQYDLAIDQSLRYDDAAFAELKKVNTSVVEAWDDAIAIIEDRKSKRRQRYANMRSEKSLRLLRA